MEGSVALCRAHEVWCCGSSCRRMHAAALRTWIPSCSAPAGATARISSTVKLRGKEVYIRVWLCGVVYYLYSLLNCAHPSYME